MSKMRHHISVHFGLPTIVIIVLNWMGMNTLINKFPHVTIALFILCTIGVIYGVVMSLIDIYASKQKKITQETLRQLTYLIKFKPNIEDKKKEKVCDQYALALMDKNIPATLLQDIPYIKECRMIIKELGSKKGIKKIKQTALEILGCEEKP